MHYKMSHYRQKGLFPLNFEIWPRNYFALCLMVLKSIRVKPIKLILKLENFKSEYLLIKIVFGIRSYMNLFSSVRVACCCKTIGFCLFPYCVFWKKKDNPVLIFKLFTCTKHQRRRAYSVSRLFSFVTTFATTLNFITFIV